jgi:hypothetical protein
MRWLGLCPRQSTSTSQWRSTLSEQPAEALCFERLKRSPKHGRKLQPALGKPFQSESNKTGSVHLVTAESPNSLWTQNWPVLNVIVSMLGIDDEV